MHTHVLTPTATARLTSPEHTHLLVPLVVLLALLLLLQALLLLVAARPLLRLPASCAESTHTWC
jgi:hypothetical protein